MKLFNPSLSLSRLAITAHGLTVYDQFFHLGVNIIRGDNSHGKSTIANFIFYVLGGDMSRWTPEAEACDFVFAEVRINGAVLTLKREVTKKAMQPLYIYFGKYTDAIQNAANGWITFGYRRSESGESFTQALFRVLQMPEVQGDGSTNVTMHQLLRLIYVDQLTAVDLLMRWEEFDSTLTRETIFSYLIGVFDNSLYDDQLALREARRQHEMTKAQLRNLERVLDKAEFETDRQKLAQRKQDIETTLTAANAQIGVLTQKQTGESLAQKDGLRPLADKIASLRKDTYLHSATLERLALEIEDSLQFLGTLEAKLVALNDSMLTRDQLGALTIHFCPQCLAPLTKPSSEKACTLCKQETAGPEVSSKVARIQQELALQIRESKAVGVKRRDEFDRHQAIVRKLHVETKRTQKEFDRLAGTVQTQRDSELDRLFQEKGRLERTLDDLQQQLKVLSIVTSLREEEATIIVRIQELEISIKRQQSAQQAKFLQALAQIEGHTLALLHQDSTLNYEAFFATARSLAINPAGNSYALDGRNQFSASSVTLLKNSIHFGIHFASLDLEYFRYPRFIVCDNMEDKGMKPQRSQNFQRAVVARSQTSAVEHQIIYTTSMIDPILEKAEFCIGPNYINDVRTLDFAGVNPPTQIDLLPAPASPQKDTSAQTPPPEPPAAIGSL
jgi:hypothetical protein